MKFFIVYFRLLIVSSLLACSACPKAVHPHFPSPDSFIELNAEQIKSFSKDLSDKANKLESFRAILIGTAEHENEGGSFRQVISHHAPNKLRVDFIVGAIKRTAAVLISPGHLIYLIDRESKAAYRGRASAENVEKLLSVPLTTREFALLYSGRVFGVGDPANSSLQVTKTDGGNYLVRIERKGFDVRRWLVDEKYRVQAFEMKKAEKLILSSTFSYAEDSSVETPASMKVWAPKRDILVEYTFEKAETNPDWKGREKRLYRVKIPKGFKIYDLDLSLPRDVTSFVNN